MSKINLSALEAGVLLLSTPGTWTGAEQRAAHKLVKRGLLKQDREDPTVFRQTYEGHDVIRRLGMEGT